MQQTREQIPQEGKPAFLLETGKLYFPGSGRSRGYTEGFPLPGKAFAQRSRGRFTSRVGQEWGPVPQSPAPAEVTHA